MFNTRTKLATLLAAPVLAIAGVAASAPTAHADATECAAYLDMIRSDENPVGLILNTSVEGGQALERIGELGTPPFTLAEFAALATDQNVRIASDEAGTDIVVELGTKCVY